MEVTMNTRKIISFSLLAILLTVGANTFLSRGSASATTNLEPGYVALEPVAFAGETCVPSIPSSEINTLYTYPDGVHPVAQAPDPSVVAAYKSEQAQISDVAAKMQAEEATMGASGADNTDPDQSILNGYIKQYNSLVAKYDTCSQS